MTLKKLASAGVLALATVGALAGPALADPHPYFGSPDIVSPTSLDGNGVLNNAITLNVCGNNALTNVLALELVPLLSPDVAKCEDVGNRDNIDIERGFRH